MTARLGFARHRHRIRCTVNINLAVLEHHRFLTVGGKIHDRDSVVPTLGVEWRPFAPFVYLPLWNVDPDPGPASPFTSVTQWKWEELVPTLDAPRQG